MKKALSGLLLMAVVLVTSCSKRQAAHESSDFALPDEPVSFPDPYKQLQLPGLSTEEAATFCAKLPYESISLSRTPCYGNCPVYTVTFYRTGKAKFEAVEHLPMLGKFMGDISPFTYGRLCYLIDNSRFKEMKKSYRAEWTDDATCIVTIAEDTSRTKVSDYGKVGPIELWAVQELIDATRDRIKWIPAQ